MKTPLFFSALLASLEDVLVGTPLMVDRYTVRNGRGLKVVTCGSFASADEVARKCARVHGQHGPFTVVNQAGREVGRYA